MFGQVIRSLLAFCLALPLAAVPASARPLDKDELDILRTEYVLANAEFTLLHEFGHAAFDVFDVPLFSREEEAADTLATVLMVLNYDVQSRPSGVDRLLMVSAEWHQEWEARGRATELKPYWDEHPLSIVRFYNINCLAMGANQDLLSLSLDTKLLPVERGWFCDREFARAKRAVEWLYSQHRRAPEVAKRRGARLPMLSMQYDKPVGPDNRHVYEILRRSRLFDRIADRLDGLMDWPVPVKVSVTNCGGSPDAFYKSQVRTIFICLDLLADFGRLADRRAAEGFAELCANPVIFRVMGRRLGCDSDSGANDSP
ncbi:hypothetical protein FHS78_000383 [Parvibaculum indicum]|uniref:DUF4344 domain-containing metallopeptidase n=1 Tax=Parvibaculum indicum TaxID=562969 RepID=UPI00141DC294|nr:DUF4344 domain-containing metallopeptidase [Parvibaculum indicum]NIJ40128.1 hypothetical protein [Parvibaculum indicum]